MLEYQRPPRLVILPVKIVEVYLKVKITSVAQYPPPQDIPQGHCIQTKKQHWHHTHTIPRPIWRKDPRVRLCGCGDGLYLLWCWLYVLFFLIFLWTGNILFILRVAELYLNNYNHAVSYFIVTNFSSTFNTLEEEEQFIFEAVKHKIDVCNCDHQWVTSSSQILVIFVFEEDCCM